MLNQCVQMCAHHEVHTISPDISSPSSHLEEREGVPESGKQTKWQPNAHTYLGQGQRGYEKVESHSTNIL